MNKKYTKNSKKQVQTTESNSEISEQYRAENIIDQSIESNNDNNLSQCFSVCPIHSRYRLTLLGVGTTEEILNQPFKCFECAREANLGLDNLLDIETDILLPDESKIFRNWPVNDPELYQRLKNALLVDQQDEASGNYVAQVKEFYKGLQARINQQIEKQLQADLLLATQFTNAQKTFIHSYNKISKKEDLTQLVEESELNLEVRSRKAKELVSKILNDQVNVKAELEAILAQRNSSRNNADFKTPILIANSICKFLNQIDFFQTKRYLQPPGAVAVSSSKEQQKSNQQYKIKCLFSSFKLVSDLFDEYLQIQAKKQGDILSEIMSLINNPFNLISEAQSTQIESEFRNFSFVFDSLRLPEIDLNSKMLHLQNINQEEIKNFSKLAIDFNQIKGQGHQQKIANENIEQLIELVRNPLNFTSNEFSQDIESEFKKYSCIFSLMKFPSRNGAKPLPVFDSLTQKDYEDIAYITETFHKNKQFQKTHSDLESHQSLEVDLLQFENAILDSNSIREQLEILKQSIKSYVNSFSCTVSLEPMQNNNQLIERMQNI